SAPCWQACALFWHARIQFCRTLPLGEDCSPPLINATCASSFNTQSLRPATLLSGDAAPTESRSAPPDFDGEREGAAEAALAIFAGGDPADAAGVPAPTRTKTQFCPVQ